MLKIENRASNVLFNFLKSNSFKNPFLLPANVCPIVPCVFLKAGIDFFFVDIDDSEAINEEVALSYLRLRTYSGILFVHSYGKRFDTKNFYSKIKDISSDICIIDDRCLCVPEFEINDENALADVILFSTGYSKYIDLDSGGWGIIRDNYNYDIHYENYSMKSYNVLMFQIKNSILTNSFLKYSDSNWLDLSPFKDDPVRFCEIAKSKIYEMVAHKEKINSIYNSCIPIEIQYSDEFNFWRYNIKIDQRDRLIEEIKSANLFAGTNYPSVAFIFKNQVAEIAELSGTRIINLFNDYRFDEQKAKKISQIICNFINTL